MEVVMTAIVVRQSSNNTTGGTVGDGGSINFESLLVQYWYVLLIVLAVLVVVCVLICACIIRKHQRHLATPATPPKRSLPIHNGIQMAPVTTNSSRHTSIVPSVSGDSTPVPSPHSSQQSVQNVMGRGRRTSPRLSSNSSDTLRPDGNSTSSTGSSASLMGHSRQEGVVMERRGSLPRRTGPMVRVTSMPDVKGQGLRSAPSTVSVESSSSGRSNVSYSFQPSHADPDTVVEVGVTVHTPGDPDKAVRIATAAALAESARKLAQEAASFIEVKDYHPPPPSITRPRTSGAVTPHSRSGSGRFSSLSQASYRQPSYSTSLAMSLDHPSLTAVRGDSMYPSQPPGSPSSTTSSYYKGPDPYYRGSDSDYHSYTTTTSLDNNYRYHLDLDSPHAYTRPQSHLSHRPSTHDEIYYGARRRASESNRRIPYHLTAAGRRESSTAALRHDNVKIDRKQDGGPYGKRSSDIGVPRPSAINEGSNSPVEAVVIVTDDITRSSSTSTGGMSSPSSHMDEQSPHPSQETMATIEDQSTKSSLQGVDSKTMIQQSSSEVPLTPSDPSSSFDTDLSQTDSRTDARTNTDTRTDARTNTDTRTDARTKVCRDTITHEVLRQRRPGLIEQPSFESDDSNTQEPHDKGLIHWSKLEAREAIPKLEHRIDIERVRPPTGGNVRREKNIRSIPQEVYPAPRRMDTPKYVSPRRPVTPPMGRIHQSTRLHHSSRVPHSMTEVNV